MFLCSQPLDGSRILLKLVAQWKLAFVGSKCIKVMQYLQYYQMKIMNLSLVFQHLKSLTINITTVWWHKNPFVVLCIISYYAFTVHLQCVTWTNMSVIFFLISFGLNDHIIKFKNITIFKIILLFMIFLTFCFWLIALSLWFPNHSSQSLTIPTTWSPRPGYTTFQSKATKMLQAALTSDPAGPACLRPWCYIDGVFNHQCNAKHDCS